MTLGLIKCTTTRIPYYLTLLSAAACNIGPSIVFGLCVWLNQEWPMDKYWCSKNNTQITKLNCTVATAKTSASGTFERAGFREKILFCFDLACVYEPHLPYKSGKFGSRNFHIIPENQFGFDRGDRRYMHWTSSTRQDHLTLKTNYPPVYAFFRDRSFTVKLGHPVSKSIPYGVPQGRALSPGLLISTFLTCPIHPNATLAYMRTTRLFSLQTE